MVNTCEIYVLHINGDWLNLLYIFCGLWFYLPKYLNIFTDHNFICELCWIIHALWWTYLENKETKLTPFNFLDSV